MKKRVLSLLLAVCATVSLLAVPAGAAQATSFYDISDRDTAVAVESLRLMGVLDGYSDGAFRPTAQLTRAQFCKMAVYAMNGEDQLGQYRTVTVFRDVKPSYWAAPYINMASKGKGIIAGYPNGNFQPGSTVTYGQAVTILMRMLGYKDEDMGGVWPDSYLASAATIGLTDGITSTGSAPLTRAQAARLFLNLLRSDGKEGSYLSTIGLTATENQVLMTSSATGSDGRDTALQMAGGQVYQLAGGKVSTGVLNGSRGTLLTNKQGQAVTFVPERSGNSRTVNFGSGTASRLVTGAGETYPINGSTSIYYNGATHTWAEAHIWLNPGTTLTLYIGESGGVEYIFAGTGSTSSSAVVVYGRGSTAGFDTLTGVSGNYNNFNIYKNGIKASVADLRAYDVATYSAATGTIRVCDTRITAYYEDCAPSSTAPSTVSILGKTFDVLPSAIESLSKFRIGDQATFLLTEDNQIAGAVAPSAATGNAVGIASVGGSSATVKLLCGVEVSGSVQLGASSIQQLNGQLVKVGSSAKGVLSLTRLTGGASGDLNTATRKLGSSSLAENVAIFEVSSGTATAIALSQIPSGILNYSKITYARTNWANQVDILVINNSSSSSGSIVGLSQFNSSYGTGGDYRSASLTIDAGGTIYGPYSVSQEMPNNVFLSVKVDRSGRLTDYQRLTELPNVGNSAWLSESAVSAGGRTYSVPSSIMCWNRTIKSWVSLDSARAAASSATLYAEDGVIRGLIVG